MRNPLRILLSIRRDEWPLSLLMFTYFFLLITGFWILKPIKKGLFIRHYIENPLVLLGWQLKAAQAEQFAKMLNILVAFLAVVAFTWLARRLRRQQLTYVVTVFVIFACLLFDLFIERPGHLFIWSFYLFGDLFSTLMVATFFAFLNDSVSPSQAKRLYGVIGLGGVSGGAFGSLFVYSYISSMTTRDWLHCIIGLMFMVLLIANLAGKSARRNADGQSSTQAMPPPAPPPTLPPARRLAGVALEGARMVFGSRYLIAIMTIVGLYEIASSILDFQFTMTIAHYLEGEAIDRQFATVYVITNVVAMSVQFFGTSFIMSRFGLTRALMVLPLAILIGSSVFLLMPVLWIGSLLNTVDGGLAYSLNQSAKETLYVPTGREEKYKAKAFIDMFVQRFAKALGVIMTLLVSALFTDFESIRWLSLVTFTVLVVWVKAVLHAGRTFNQIASYGKPGEG